MGFESWGFGGGFLRRCLSLDGAHLVRVLVRLCGSSILAFSH